MARDPEIGLCMNCSFRPKDNETGMPAEGGLRIGSRITDVGKAVVIYSEVDPRNNGQFSVVEGKDANSAVRIAQACTPMAMGLPLSMMGFDAHISRVGRNDPAVCRVNDVLYANNNLPEGLLYQVAVAVKE
jgi:hypothetical protein